jgi:hypothetical protein
MLAALRTVHVNPVRHAVDVDVDARLEGAVHQVYRPTDARCPAAALGRRVHRCHGSRLVHAAVQHAASRLEGPTYGLPATVNPTLQSLMMESDSMPICLHVSAGLRACCPAEVDQFCTHSGAGHSVLNQANDTAVHLATQPAGGDAAHLGYVDSVPVKLQLSVANRFWHVMQCSCFQGRLEACICCSASTLPCIAVVHDECAVLLVLISARNFKRSCA